MLIRKLRWYMREKTKHNNIVPVPLMELFGWAALAPDAPVKSTRSEELLAAGDLLHDAKLCDVVMQQTQSGQVVPMLRTTEEGRRIPEAEIEALICPPSPSSPNSN